MFPAGLSVKEQLGQLEAALGLDSADQDWGIVNAEGLGWRSPSTSSSRSRTGRPTSGRLHRTFAGSGSDGYSAIICSTSSDHSDTMTADGQCGLASTA